MVTRLALYCLLLALCALPALATATPADYCYSMVGDWSFLMPGSYHGYWTHPTFNGSTWTVDSGEDTHASGVEHWVTATSTPSPGVQRITLHERSVTPTETNDATVSLDITATEARVAGTDYIFLQAPLTQGSSWTYEVVRDGVTAHGTSTIAAVDETVVTPGGTFTNCVRLECTETGDLGSTHYTASRTMRLAPNLINVTEECHCEWRTTIPGAPCDDVEGYDWHAELSAYGLAPQITDCWAESSKLGPRLAAAWGGGYMWDIDAVVTDRQGAADVAGVTITFPGDSPVYSLYDDGTHGDISAADGTYQQRWVQASALPVSASPYTFTVTDQGDLSTSVTTTLPSETVEPFPSIPTPVAPTHGGTISTTTPTLSWQASTNVTSGYDVWIWADALPPALSWDMSKLAWYTKHIAGTSIAVPAGVLLTGHSYCWMVVARDDGPSDNPNSRYAAEYASFTVSSGAVPPTAPTNLTATAQSSSSVRLTWTDNSTTETGLVIERRLGTGAYAYAATAGVNTTSWTDTGCARTTSYTYRVCAENAAGRSDWVEATVKTPSFDDVLPSSAQWAYVEAMYRESITGGCSQTPPLYCPDSAVTRGQMAVFLCRAAGWSPVTPETPSFADVPKTSAQYGYIEAMKAHGVTGGCGGVPLNYCPNSPVTRGQMAVFLCRAAGVPTQNPATATFTDVPNTNPQYIYIEGMLTAGITAGCSQVPKKYCPDSPVTRGQMAVFLCRAFEISTTP